MPERCYTKAMKISDDSLEFLTELLETPSPSGFEIDAQRIWADELRKYKELLDGGAINGMGTHETLLSSNQIYQEVYYSQNRTGGADNG